MNKKYIILLFFLLCIIINFPPSFFLYDEGWGKYNFYKEKIANLDAGESIDFSDINNGEWTRLCIFGGYTNPHKYMKNYGNVSIFDRMSGFIKKASLFRFDEIEELETAVAYVREDQSVKIIHINSSPALLSFFSLEHVRKCTLRDNPVIKFDR